jgi:hypothetical protein
MSARQEKITFADMRAAGVRGILVYSDYRCSHSLALMADQWPDCMRLSDLAARTKIISVSLTSYRRQSVRSLRSADASLR